MIITIIVTVSFFLAELGVKVAGEPIYDWNCVSEDIFERSSIKMSSTQCEKRCAEHKDCRSCLKGTGAEGGWQQCRWSTQLNEVCVVYKTINIV